MENASKALLMAGGVLISIMVISLITYLFISFGDIAREKHRENEQQQIEQYNANFTSYQGKQCTIYDVITLANLATENNKYYNYEKRTSDTDINGKDSYISVKIKKTTGGYKRIECGRDQDSSDIFDFNNDLIKEDTDKINITTSELPKYELTDIKISKYTSRVYEVTFEPK